MSEERQMQQVSLRKSPLGRWSDARRVIISLTTSQVGTIAITSALGVIYWWIAARWFAPQAVGFAAAAVSAMTLFGTFSMLGLGTLLIRELPKQRADEGSLITTALLLAGITGGILGLLCGLIAPHLSSDLRPLATHTGTIAVFALGVGITSVALVTDQVLIGLLRGTWQFGRNAIFAVAKLVGLGVVVAVFLKYASGLAIYLTWLAGTAVSLVVLFGIVIWQGGGLHGFRPQWRALHGLELSALTHHALNLGVQAPALAIPALIAIMLSASDSAYFYTTWMIASGVAFAIPFALTMALYAIGFTDAASLSRKVRFTLRLAVLAGLLGAGVLLLGAGALLGIFGPLYAQNATVALRILGLAVFPLIIKDHFVAICRVRGRVTHAALLVGAGGLLEVLLAMLGGRLGGLPGVSAGWTIALCIEAIALAYPVVRVAFANEGG